jgi:PAS domain S-box-containing protein
MGMKEDKEKISILIEDLASLESYARDLFSFLPLSVFLVNPIGIVLETNPAFEEISGYKIEEAIGKPIETFFIKEEIEEILKETLEKGFVKEREINFFTKDKRKIPVNIFTTLRKSEEGEIIGYLIAFFDLTKIKKREMELKNAQSALLNILEDVEEARERAEEEKNKTLAIIQNFADGLLVFDKEGKVSLINPQAENFCKVKEKEVIGKSILELSQFPNFKPMVEAVGKELKGVFRKEVPIREDLILEVTNVPIMREEEKIGTLMILHDVTREKMIED